MTSSFISLGLSQRQNGKELAAVVIRFDAMSPVIIKQTHIANNINALHQLIARSEETINAIGYFRYKDSPGVSKQDLQQLSDHAILFKGDNVSCGKQIDFLQIRSGLIAHRYELDISAFTGLLENLAARLYDTPVDVTGKIIALGSYSARLNQKLKTLIPPLNRPWRQSQDDELALKILGYALRRRIEEPQILYTLYDYLIGYIAASDNDSSKTYYLAGPLTAYPWIIGMFSRYVKACLPVEGLSPSHFEAFRAALLATAKQPSHAEGKQNKRKESTAVDYSIIYIL
jgi:hypothetical protein